MVFGEVFGDVWGTASSTQGAATTFVRETFTPPNLEDNAYFSAVDDFLFSPVLSGGSVASGVVTPSTRIPESEKHLRASASSSNAYTSAYHPEPPPVQTWETVAEEGETLIQKWVREDTEKAEGGYSAIPQGWATTSPLFAQPEPVAPETLPPVDSPSFIEQVGDASLKTFKIISPLNVKAKIDFISGVFKHDIQPGEGETTVGDGLKDLFGIDDLNLGNILPTAGITTLLVAGAAIFFLGPSLMRRF